MEIVEVEEDRPPKRIKTDETTESKGVEEDRISALPDCLIIEILSRLPSTKYAIRTSTLSKRWTHLWLSVPTLIFLPGNQSNADFFVSVGKTLTQYHCQSKLKKFKINSWYDSRFESQVNSCIRHAINHNVEDLCLRFWNWYIVNEFFVIKDEFFFTSSCFTHLELEGCKFNPSGPISWKNLTSLYITFVKLDENLIQNILSGSPLLETLNLHKCYGFLRLDITSKSVKNLVLSGYIDPRSVIHKRIIEINAPNILSLLIQDDLLLRKLVLLNVSSLLKVELNYTQSRLNENVQVIKKDEILKGLLLSLRHVKQIKIGTSCYEAFFHLEAKGFKFPSNVKFLDSPQVAVWSD